MLSHSRFGCATIRDRIHRFDHEANPDDARNEALDLLEALLDHVETQQTAIKDLYDELAFRDVPAIRNL